MTRRFRRVLVANRGEIAVRVIRTCARLGIETALAASDADLDSVPARLADRVARIGPAPAGASYLNVDAVVRAALAAGADAAHPGYGFLSENARLARLWRRRAWRSSARPRDPGSDRRQARGRSRRSRRA